MRPDGIRRLFRFPSRNTRDIHNDVRDEVAFHLEMRTKDLIAEGSSPQDARAQALREFGDLKTSERALVTHGGGVERRRGLSRLAAEFRQDLGYGVRLAVRDKGFSIAAVLTLAVAIGGNTAMFSIINALFFQPLAVRAPNEIVRVYTGQSTTSWPNVEDMARRNQVFDDVFAQGNADVSMATDPLPVRLAAGLVSPNYFAALGAAPLAGRVFRPDDPHADVVMLSERLWRARFGGSPAAVGQQITIDTRRVEIVGVMPRTFRGIAPAGLTRDLWMPLDVHGVHRGLAADRAATRFEVFARLKPGVSEVEAGSAMRVLGTQLEGEHPKVNERFSAIEVSSASGIGLYRGVGKTLLPVFMFIGFLTVVAGFVLLISCANLAGLLLGRAAVRKQEIAVRLALGAGRGRLVRQLLTESLVLAIAGGAAGLLLANGALTAMARAVAGLPVPIELNLQLDRLVLLYTFVISVGCALLFGLAPARRAARAQLVDALKIAGGGVVVRQRLRHALIVAQVAVSALLLFWSGLFVRSLQHVNSVDPGFTPAGVLLADVQLADDAPGAQARAETAFVDLLTRVREFPGVEGAGWSTIVPLAFTGNERFRVAKADTPADVPGVWIVSSRLSPGWFDAVRIPMVAGRDFTWADGDGAPDVAVVNETLARQFWNGAAVSERLRIGNGLVEVVGVVRDSKYWTLGEPISPTVYRPFRQAYAPHTVTMHVRTADPRDTAARLRREIQSVVPGSAPDIKPMTSAVAGAVIPARIGAAVTAGFGLLGAFLATLGVYGLISYVVAQRSREMAIRRAIGAPSAHIVQVVIGGTLTLAGAGLALGIALGALTAPLLGGLLVNVSPRDPLTAVLTAMVVLAATALASAPPAFRAASIAPLEALKDQ